MLYPYVVILWLAGWAPYWYFVAVLLQHYIFHIIFFLN
jgi:hypothetical protein